MKYISASIFISIIFSIFACTKLADNKSEMTATQILAKGSVVVIDTVKFKYDGTILLPVDWRAGKILYFDFFNLDVLASDLKGNLIAHFKGGLMGANDFGDHIYGARFMDDSTVMVLSERGYFLSDLKGNVKKRYKHPFDMTTGVYMNGDFHLDYDPKRHVLAALLRTTSLSRMDRPDFYRDLSHLTLFNLDSQTYKNKITYEPDSYYLNGKYFNNEFAPHFSIHNDVVSIVYPLDPKIYLYTMGDYKLINSFDTKPEHFHHPVKFPFGGGQVETKQRLTGYANSFNYRLFCEGDTTIHSYTSGIDLGFFDKINNMEDYNANAYRELSYYLQFFIRGEKQISDLELPKEFPMISLYSKGTMLLIEQERWMNKKDGYKRFLLCRLSVEPKNAHPVQTTASRFP